MSRGSATRHGVENHPSMAGRPPNILVVSDLHFGEELLPGASTERRQRRRARRARRSGVPALPRRRAGVDGRPWRLVIAGDLFDFMSVVIPAPPDAPGAVRRRAPLRPRPRHRAGVVRMRRDLREPPAAARRHGRGSPPPATRSTSSSATTTSSCSTPEVVAELERQLRARRRRRRAAARIRVVPWFVYVPGVAWIEHGHVYDEGCSFEFNLAPDRSEERPAGPQRRLRRDALPRAAVPEIDPHGIEEWSFWGYMQLRAGARACARSAGCGVAYAPLHRGRCSARARMHQSLRRPRPPPPRPSRAPRARSRPTGGLSARHRARDRSPRAHAADGELAPARPHADARQVRRSSLGALVAILALLVLAAARVGAARRGRRGRRRRVRHPALARQAHGDVAAADARGPAAAAQARRRAGRRVRPHARSALAAAARRRRLHQQRHVAAGDAPGPSPQLHARADPAARRPCCRSSSSASGATARASRSTPTPTSARASRRQAARWRSTGRRRCERGAGGGAAGAVVPPCYGSSPWHVPRPIRRSCGSTWTSRSSIRTASCCSGSATSTRCSSRMPSSPRACSI